ncbi:MAG: hypothetical protein LUC90_05740, partial [Lachnospiraceae bacterium]|nr:hypothetical protein [Lachnospiraceae bacterium]
MAEKDLRRMNRAELIEIIYVMQQNEKALRQENDDLRQQRDEKLIRMREAGSIAEAALRLNHIFEDAQNASRQYLDSLEALATSEDEQTRQIIGEAKEQARKTLEDANEQARSLLSDARSEAEKVKQEAPKLLADARAQAERTRQEAQEEADSLVADAQAQAE